MFKKITKESKKWQIVSGIITGVLAAVLCVSFGLMSAVSSTAVYQSAYKKGCVSPDMDIDGDNFASYYNAMLKFSSFGDAAKLEQARFTAAQVCRQCLYCLKNCSSGVQRCNCGFFYRYLCQKRQKCGCNIGAFYADRFSDMRGNNCGIRFLCLFKRSQH